MSQMIKTSLLVLFCIHLDFITFVMSSLRMRSVKSGIVFILCFMESHEQVVQLKECSHNDKGNSTNRGTWFSSQKKRRKKKNSFNDANLRFLKSNRSLWINWWQGSENILVCGCCLSATEMLCLPSFFYEFMAMTLGQKYRNPLPEDCLRQHD